MSTEQPTLGESIERQATKTRDRAHDVLEETGAMYGARPKQPDADTKPVPMCRGCGLDLSEIVGSHQRAREVSRVVGDNEGHVPGCPECVQIRDSGRQITSVASAANIARKRGGARP